MQRRRVVAKKKKKKNWGLPPKATSPIFSSCNLSPSSSAPLSLTPLFDGGRKLNNQVGSFFNLVVVVVQ
ncbi:unnamed protein product [Linum trigynum]|uniref:Ribosomal protein S12 n=1 Tax=Linum trigynum TaxID=586398 RepID=A0AAV2EWT6_9ROSI